MTPAYKRYLKLNIDGSCIGLERGEGKSNYFCTPKGAKVIGWIGVDGIHYCFVPDFGEMVFAVSPMNTPENYVHPVAKDFTDFLRLLLACGDAAVLEQVYWWDQAQFDTFLQDNSPTVEQQAMLDTIREKLLLTPMEQPLAYIKNLQAGFDYSRIKYTKDYYEQMPAELKMPEWKVYFNGNFWGRDDRERAGREISLDKRFTWGDEVWHIPVIYICSKGVVVDFCMRVSSDRIRSFIDKWDLSVENDGADFSNEQQMQANAENPLSININPTIAVNGTVLSSSHGCGLSWNPCISELNGPISEGVIQHYGLDPAYGWAIWRSAFPWAKKGKPRITALSVTLEQEPVAMPGPHFHASVSGGHIGFIHPGTGVQHTLTVRECERQEMPHEHFGNRDQEFPTHYIVMSYTLSPELPDGAFTVADCACSDRPRQKYTDSNELQASDSACIGIIGVANGPTAIICDGNARSKLHVACSALHFEPVSDVKWHMVFHEKRREDVKVELI